MATNVVQLDSFACLSLNINCHEFIVRHCLVRKTRTSASEFYKGLTKVITGLALSDVTPIIRDDTMKFYENCPNYDVSVLKNENVQYELNTFINSS
jgi:hypothetical protein